MIPASQSAYNIYSGGSAATVFDFEFDIQDSDDLLVYVYDVPSDTKTTLVLDTDYTISGNSITLSSPLEENKKIILLSAKSVQQQYDFFSSGKFDPQRYEDALDYVVTLIKQNERDARFAFKLPFGIDDVDVTMPKPVASKLLKWNSQGNKIENSTTDADELESVANRIHASIDNIDAVANDLENIDSCVEHLAEIRQAPASATAAKNSATASAKSATSAQNSATSALASATSAENSATSASDSATSAQNSATSASDSATSAQNSATSASDSATSAQNSATSASASATAAQNSATSASTSAQSLQDSITTINSKIKKNEDDISSVTTTIENIRESYGSLSGNYNQFVQTDYKQKQALEKSINAVSSELSDAKKNLNAKIEANTIEINSVRSATTVNTNDIDALEQYTYKKYNEITSRITDNETNISSVSSDLDDTKTSLSDLKEFVEKQGSAAYTRFAINKANCYPYSCDIDLCDYEWADVSYNDFPVIETIGFKIGGDYPPLVYTNANGKTFEVTETPTALNPADYHHSRSDDNWENDMVYINSTGIHVEASCEFYVTNTTDILGQVPEGHTGIVLCTNSEPIKTYLVKNGVLSDFDGVPLFSFATGYAYDGDVPKYFFSEIKDTILKKIGYNAYSFNTNVLPYNLLVNVNNTVLNIEYADAQYDEVEIDLSKALYYFTYKAKFNFEFKTSMSEEVSIYLHSDAYKIEIEDENVEGQYVGRTSNGVLQTSFDADIVGQKITLRFKTDSGAKVKFDKAMLTMLTVVPQNVTTQGFVYNEENEPIYGDGSICYVVHVQDDEDITLTHYARRVKWNSTDEDILSGLGTFTIDWGDGIVENYSGTDWTTSQSHTYSASGDYTVKITCDTEGSLIANFGWTSYFAKDEYSFQSGSFTPYKKRPALNQVKEIKSVPPAMEYCTGVGCLLNLSSVPNNIFYNVKKIGGAMMNTAVTTISKALFGRKKTSEFLPAGGNWSAGSTDKYWEPSGAIFQRCVNITEIPEDLFENFDSIESLCWCFRGCESLTTVPARLFKNTLNLQDCEEMFRGCTALTEIPENLFENAPDSLNELAGMFALTGLVSIPEKLFEFLPNWKGSGYSYTLRRNNEQTGLYAPDSSGNVEKIELTPPEKDYSTVWQYNKRLYKGVFAGCHFLTNIPAGLFAQNGQLENLFACFQDCGSLINIPENLFANNPNLKNLGYLFDCCNNMVLNANIFGEDNTRFSALETTEDSPLDFTCCFRINPDLRTTQEIGTAPDIWNWELPEYVEHTGCFHGHSAETLTNYADIPDDWK